MNKFFQTILISLTLALSVLALLYYPEIKESITKEKDKKFKEESDFAKAEQLLTIQRPVDASNIIKNYMSSIEKNEEKGRDWLELFITASEKIPDIEQLVYIFHYHPQSFARHENAALMVASHFLSEKDTANYETLRSLFKNKEETAEWFILNADYLTLQGKNEEAVQLLKSRYFEGSKDTPRLVRLALFHINEHPKVAWEYLDQVLQKDPYNEDIRLYRALLLKSAQKNDLAIEEIREAAKTVPSLSPHLKEELLHIYLENHDYKQANEYAKKALEKPTNSDIFLGALFLNKTVKPIPYNFKNHGLPHNEASELISYLTSLKKDQFWSEAAPSLGSSSSEDYTFWLKVLHKLKNHQEDDALILVNNYKNSFDTELQDAVGYILEKRKYGESQKTYNDLAKPLAYEMRDNNVFSLLFLNRGWKEAAILLKQPGQYPEIGNAAFAKALKDNRTLKEAIQFLAESPSPEDSLYLSELYIENKTPDLAIRELEKISHQNNTLGIKSSWIKARLLFDQGNYDSAIKAIDAHTRLSDSKEGKEFLARAYIKLGNNDLAEKHYADISNDSDEAKVFLAQNAYYKKDFQTALKFTKELLSAYPDNQTLKENLKKIEDALK